MIRNILFDLDDTLLDFQRAEREALKKTLKHLNVEPKKEILSRYSEINSEQWRLLEQGIITRDEVKVRRYRLLFLEFNIQKDALYTTKYYEPLLKEGHCFIEGAQKLLETLHRDYRLYIVSNGNALVQQSRIKSAGIKKYFKDIFISEEIGFDKPSIDFFNHCFSKIEDFKKCETIIVGDSLTSDIKGGKTADIKTVWFNPKGVLNTTDIIPHHEIHHLLSLMDLLNIWGA